VKPKALVLQAHGTNRDLDVMNALTLAGADPIGVPLNNLRSRRTLWQDFQLLVVPGGFSYADALGPVKITAEPAEGAARLQIGDLGYGMDPETIRKATYPFFSAKPAGRKRGMGLAYAARFIQLNRGALAIESHPEHGTTVTITLPYA